jgi:hypothetical protein
MKRCGNGSRQNLTAHRRDRCRRGSRTPNILLPSIEHRSSARWAQGRRRTPGKNNATIRRPRDQAQYNAAAFGRMLDRLPSTKGKFSARSSSLKTETPLGARLAQRDASTYRYSMCSETDAAPPPVR